MFVFLQKKMNNIKHLRQGSFWNLVDLTWNGPIARPLRQKFKHSTTYSCLRSYIHTVWTSVACCCSADVTSGKPAQSPALRHICLLTPTLHAISGRYHRGPAQHTQSQLLPGSTRLLRYRSWAPNPSAQPRLPANGCQSARGTNNQTQLRFIKNFCKLQHVWFLALMLTVVVSHLGWKRLPNA